MGIDLTLLPLSWYERDNMKENYALGRDILAYQRLGLVRDHELFDLIKSKGKPKALGRNITDYGDEGLKTHANDAYGTPLTYCLAGDLKLTKKQKADLAPWNKAVLAMMEALPPDWPVILYWH